MSDLHAYAFSAYAQKMQKMFIQSPPCWPKEARKLCARLADGSRRNLNPFEKTQAIR
jgi:hypothetical protein